MQEDEFEIEISLDEEKIPIDFKMFDIEINDPISEEDLRLEQLESLVLNPKKD